MALTPLDIQNKTFPTKMRGYNQDEVDDFLDLVVRDYEELTQRNRELEKAVKHSEEKLEYFNELKDALNQSIIVAQDTADKVKTSASKESEVIVTSAQNKADELVANAEKRAHQLTTDAEEKARKILTDATEKARQLATETEDLKKKTRVFHQRISLMLESQLEQVKSPEWDEILQPFSSYVTDSHEVIKEVLAKQLDNENDTDVNSDTGVIEAPMTAFDTQAIDISIVPGQNENE
ncbi:DivIVA domain-containing protein [Enterococcus faecium]|uniref:DivIVA domain-containing protein n=1 Tax=Enterococcus faecium TaxID=1352 RepID=UPI0005C6F0AA|nr:DivIVA domain-containing protein [Enterococcus faecium]EGP4725297.1 DivIVA domain-containing protein [Enterococcus faecium]EGP5323890.1 DivIVA domain-containing protein [Enterococcus faecium]EGP5690116.1 DivIVA domain-containing protein [Enterococcus faecium]EGP5732082.1 DivIVA domain-containing protein [Enterococcus faecium]EME7115372.1 DivIVA domain-containing protein [Enterococcus faecium]